VETIDHDGAVLVFGALLESRNVWDCISNMGGKLHLKLNTGERPIANKYREGKLK
jgi:hypothetical protein